MQLFSADTQILKKNAHENIKKLPSKVAHNQPNFFISTANRPKTSPNLNFCSIKNAHRATYVANTALYVVRRPGLLSLLCYLVLYWTELWIDINMFENPGNFHGQILGTVLILILLLMLFICLCITGYS
jgi:hypothetical protein